MVGSDSRVSGQAARSTREATVSDLQRQVQGLIDGLVESGSENGVQVAVYRRGDLMVDAVAGAAGPGTGWPAWSG